MLTDHVHEPIRDEKDRPLNTDETLLLFFEQRAYQLVMAVRENYARTGGSIDRHYQQALIYLEGIGWMVRYGQLDSRMRKQAEIGMETFLKIFAEIDSITAQEKNDRRFLESNEVR